VRATLLGHACWIIETSAGCLLTDPVFFDPFEEGTVVSCPRRQIHVEQLPALQGVFVSHRHLDHFDFPSLVVLDRNLPVYCPADPLLVYGLRYLGFTRLHFLEPFISQRLGNVRLLPTPSLNRDVQECGLVVQDDRGTLFHQVDTFLAPEAVRRLQHEVGPLDIHLTMYASQNFGFFESQRQPTAAMYSINLNTALQLQARCVVPASAGFRFTDDLAWLNRHVFPISRERFVNDLQRLAPALHTEIINPGDALTVRPGRVEVERQQAPYVTMLAEDTWRLAYDPSAPVPPLQDHNPAGYGLQGLQEFAQGVLEVGLPQYLQHGLATGETIVRQYAEHGVVYQVEVVFPDASRFWTYTFNKHALTYGLTTGTGSSIASVYKRITASALVDFCLGRRSYVSIRTQSRRASMVLALVPGEQGVAVREVELPDLLIHYVVHFMAGADRRGADWVHFVTQGLR
jgi:L-ascorbate metabolism protein UlaG (beta-lactamase superfamily)